MNDKIRPGIIGGVVLGLLSVIPFVNLANLCCCLWALLGGLIGTYLYIKRSPTPVSAGDGAMVGVIAGLVGAVIAIIIGVPINLLVGPTMARIMVNLISNLDARQGELVREGLTQSQNVTSIIIRSLISAVLLFIFAIVGGLLGVPIFERRKGGAVVPPPPAVR